MTFPWASFDKIDSLEEGLYLDRKAEYKVTDDKRIDIIKDLIALANTSRLTGRECYMLLGVTDDLKKDGIPNLPEDPTKRIKSWESFKHQLEEIGKQSIDPELIIDIDNLKEIEGKFFSVITFTPTRNPKPYTVKKAPKGKLAEIQPGQAWVRSAESNKEIKPNNFYYHLNFGLVPLMLPGNWLAFCKNQQDSLMRLQTEPAETFQRLRAANGLYVDDAIDEFLGSEHRLLILEGVAGSGKSTLVQHTFKRLLDDFQHRCSLKPSKEVISNIGLVPIYYPLRHIQTKTSITRRLITSLGIGGKGSQPDLLFDLPQAQWLIILDGFDECSDSVRKHLLDEIRSLVEMHKSIKVILVSRPVLPNWVEAFHGQAITQVRITPLDAEQIENYLAQCALERDSVKKALSWIACRPEIKEMLQWPIFLAASSNYLIPQPVKPLSLDASNEQFADIDAISASSPAVEATTIKYDNASEHDPSFISIARAEEIVLTEPLVKDFLDDTLTLDSHPANSEQNELIEAELSLSKLVDRVMVTLIERECEKLAVTKEQINDWRGRLEIRAWFGGDEDLPFSWSYARKHLSPRGLSWFLNLGVLRDEPTYALVVFFNHLVRCYFAARYLCVLAETHQKKKAEDLLAKAASNFQDEVIAFAGELANKDLSRSFGNSIQGGH
jgi:hypothetical protein